MEIKKSKKIAKLRDFIEGGELEKLKKPVLTSKSQRAKKTQTYKKLKPDYILRYADKLGNDSKASKNLGMSGSYIGWCRRMGEVRENVELLAKFFYERDFEPKEPQIIYKEKPSDSMMVVVKIKISEAEKLEKYLDILDAEAFVLPQ